MQFPIMNILYFTLVISYDSEMFPVSLTITGITFFTFHKGCISVVSSLYFKTFGHLSRFHFYLLKLQCPLTDTFLRHCHGL
jgi:hypothetical protein